MVVVIMYLVGGLCHFYVVARAVKMLLIMNVLMGIEGSINVIYAMIFFMAFAC